MDLSVIKEESSWFNEGLRFKCTGCGKCCTGSPGYVWLTSEEVQKIAEYLNISVDECASRYIRVKNGAFSLKERVKTYDCVFLEGTKCAIYPVRPRQCKTFPWWVQNLETKEDWERAALRCEGINHPDAPIVPKNEIVQVLEDGDGIDAFSECN